MARNSDILLGATAWSTGNDNPQLNPLLGGQFGYSSNPEEWLSAQAHLPRNLIPVVIEAPGFFKLMPNGEKWVAAWKLMFEKHARTIEGLKAGLSVETSEHDFGRAGEKFEEFTDVKRERSTLSINLVEKYGNVFQNYLERVITYGMMHPDTGIPLIATMENAPTDLLADMYGGTIAFIEPNPVGNRCVRCWLSTNVFPKGTGSIEGKMDKVSALSIKELSLEFTSLTFVNDGTRALGQKLLADINTRWANPQLRKSFVEGVSADVAAVAKGWKESVESVAANRVGDLI